MENSVETKITIYRKGQEETMLFTCPKCGSHKLLEENDLALVQLSVSSIDIESNGGKGVELVDCDWTRDCEIVDLMDDSITTYVCNDCGYELEDNSKEGEKCVVSTQHDLAEWIVRNCKP